MTNEMRERERQTVDFLVEGYSNEDQNCFD